MRVVRFAIALAVFLVFATAQLNAAPILFLSDGVLTGAHNVNILGSLYDVRFQDGTCIELFNGCNDASDFIFTVDDERSVFQALIDQVFIDSGSPGLFSSHPELTSGCGLLDPTCYVITPVNTGSFGSSQQFVFGILNHPDTPDELAVAYIPKDASTFDSVIGRQSVTYAVWQRAAVPEPATLSLLGIGLCGLLLLRKRLKLAVR